MTAPYTVDLPGGGQLALNSSDEVQLWNDAAQRYIADYGLTKQNDLVLLGAVLSQGLAMYRAQQQLSDPKNAASAAKQVATAATEIREMEKALGIDKKSREAGGQHTVRDYVTRLKAAAHAKGVHITDRVKAYEAVMMEARWKIRLLRNGDEEDRSYHAISEKSIIDWLERELAQLEVKDREWAKEKGALFVGKL